MTVVRYGIQLDNAWQFLSLELTVLELRVCVALPAGKKS